MILATRGHGNLEVRSTFGPNTAIPPAPWANTLSASGQVVNTQAASGVAAIGAAIRLWAGLVASCCLEVYEGEYGSKRLREDAWQYELFERPGLGVSEFDWLYDISAGLEADENAYLLKTKSRGRVVELLPIPLDCVRADIDRRTGRKRFGVSTGQGNVELDSGSVLHIRGQTVNGGAFGVSRIVQHRDPVGAMIAAQRFEGSYYKNHARPDIAISYPQGITPEQARQWTEVWNTQFGGADNAGKAATLTGGASVAEIGASSMRDSQYVETREFSVQEAGRIMDTDPVLLGAGGDAVDKKAALDFAVRVQLPPRLKRISSALHADPDLFGIADSVYPQFRVPDMLVTDALTRSQIQHEEIQDGRLLVDEARAELGRPPLPPVPADWAQAPGMVPQITPVGGAPNPAADTTPTP